MDSDSIVRARIDTSTKERATAVLSAMGLNVSDAIRLMLMRVATEQRMPFDVKMPDATTVKAMRDLESGKGKRSATLEELFRDLGI